MASLVKLFRKIEEVQDDKCEICQNRICEGGK